MIFLCLILSSMLSAGNAEFDRTASEGAARITMGRFVRSLRQSGLPSGVLSSEMLKNPESFYPFSLLGILLPADFPLLQAYL